jgi:UDP-glucose 4-epimerase
VHVLVTGGCGYIGSHTVLELVAAGHRVTVVDNLSNASALSLRQVEDLTGQPVAFAEFDVRDADRLDALFGAAGFDAVVHFAGLKAVGESVDLPLDYYDNNVGSTLTLARTMKAHGVRRLVFSSSATVYGDPSTVPIPETATIAPTNPYGRTKAMIEQILGDLTAAGGGWQICVLRYFNPVGAHASGQIGEDPTGVPNNLLPYVAQVAVGRRPQLQIFGDDYDTPDGTGVRDYIHVVDLALGHLAALVHLPAPDTCLAINLGTGTGSSVLQVVRAFEQASGRTIPYVVVPRRPGDIAAAYAEVSLAHELLGWKAERSLADACADTWRWQSQHPDGYR